MRKIHAEHGFSLTEVVVSTALFSLVAAGLGATTIGTIQANHTSRNLSVATTLMQDQIETMMALDPSVPADAALLTNGSDDPNALGLGGGHFTRTWTVTHHQPKFGLATVQVEVTWPGAAGGISGVAYVCNLPNCA